MRALERINVFWLGAGALLVTFGGNELVADLQSKVLRWLGGRWAVGGAVFAILVGLAVMYGLGIREPVESDADGDPKPLPEAARADDLEA